jgi:hypothetical protein
MSDTAASSKQAAEASGSDGKPPGQQRLDQLIAVRAGALGKKGGDSSFWKHLEPVLDDDGTCKLQCKLCDKLLSATNPSMAASSHLVAEPGTKPQCIDSRKRAASTSNGPAGSSKKPAAGQASMRQFVPSEAAKASAAKQLCLFFYR